MLTQQQIAQLLPFDKEKALKFPDFVYWKDGVKANKNCITMIKRHLHPLHPNYWSDHFALFPHRKVELWLMYEDLLDKVVIVAAEDSYRKFLVEHGNCTDLNQSVTVLIFDETLLNT